MAQTTVFYNGVRDIEFDVADKSGLVHTVVIKGSGAGIRGVTGQPLPAVGAYGVTVVDADIWAAVKAAFAEHPVFKLGFVKDGESKTEKEKAKEEVSALDNGQGAAKQEEAGKKKTRKK